MGAEGTIGVVTNITLKIFPWPEHRCFEMLKFGSVKAALDPAGIMNPGKLGLNSPIENN